MPSPKFEARDKAERQQSVSDQAQRLLAQLRAQKPGYCFDSEAIADLPATAEALAAIPEGQVQLVLKAFELIGALRERLGPPEGRTRYLYWNLSGVEGYPWSLAFLARRLLRRSLPFSNDELLFMVERLAHLGCVRVSAIPLVENLVAILEKRFQSLEINEALACAVQQLDRALNDVSNAPEQKLRRRLGRLLTGPLKLNDQRTAGSTANVSEAKRLKSGIAHSGALGSFLEEARRRLAELEKFAAKDYRYRWTDIESHPATKAILSGPSGLQRSLVLATVDGISQVGDGLGKLDERNVMSFSNLWHEKDFPKASVELTKRLLRRRQEFTDDEVFHIVERLARLPYVSLFAVPIIGEVVGLCEDHAVAAREMPRFARHLAGIQEALGICERAAEKKLINRIQALLTGPQPLHLLPGETWSDAAIADLKGMTDKKQGLWLQILVHCQSSSGGSPSAKWLGVAPELVKELGWPEFRKRLQTWFPLVNEPRTQTIREWHRGSQPDPNQLIIEPHADILKGLAWSCGLKEDKALARALTALALSAYRKIPLKGPREVKIGNACVTALGMMPGMEGLYQLALLKVRVKFGTAQKFVDKALNIAAERSGLPRSELEEMAVPAYGLSEVGRRVEKVGDYTAELSVTGSDSTSLTWLKPDGKRQTSIPPVVKEKFGEDLEELRSAAKDIQRMLPPQRERLDNLFREQKTWPFNVWRERYLDHPLVGVLARRLIWEVTSGKKATAGIFFNGTLVDLDLKPLQNLAPESSVQLWHPIGKEPEEIVAWRSWLDAQQIQQPFKQAHREVYLLTDAERDTRTYSNRFAAHILRQHQFNALCATRGWKNKLRLMVDAEFPPATVHLPNWNLRAEFWIEGIGEDYGTDTNDAGVFLRVSTDQVRFYRLDAAQRMAHAGGGGYRPGYREAGAEPVPLEEIPPLVFSEVMRDVDLFVGVASVGNDPTWSDGGPEGRYREYWQNYSFGELNASAKTRKDVLQRLVPRLKIAGKCSFQDKFLVIKGGIRTYKIHLGSGNILMEPNDQYLCIVPDSGHAKESAGDVFLPFEDDRTLSIILSKAFLLAEDEKIKDETITRQIRTGG